MIHEFTVSLPNSRVFANPSSTWYYSQHKINGSEGRLHLTAAKKPTAAPRILRSATLNPRITAADSGTVPGGQARTTSSAT
jgi:hypothetical protein